MTSSHPNANPKDALEKLKGIASRVQPENHLKKELEKKASEVSSEVIIKGTRIRDSIEEGICEIHFNKIPSEKIRKLLKKYDFQWDGRSWWCKRTSESLELASMVVRIGG